MILVTNIASITHHETRSKGEWATILDPATGAMVGRYVLRSGRVERMQ